MLWKLIFLIFSLLIVFISAQNENVTLETTTIQTTALRTTAIQTSTFSTFLNTTTINVPTLLFLNTTPTVNTTLSTMNKTNSIQSKPLAKQKAHANLMIIAWIFLASSGIIIARYYDYIFKNINWFKIKFSKMLHILLMIFVPILSIISFFVILSDNNWKWVERNAGLKFAHSIVGIIAVSLSVIQPAFGFLNIKIKQKILAKIIRYIHRVIGFIAFVLATISLYFGFFISDINLDATGWGILIGWSSWIIVLPLLLEVFEIIFKVKDEHDLLIEQKSGSSEIEKFSNKVKNKEKNLAAVQNILLVLHFMVASSISGILIFYVTRS
ncbi:unnamed protein product [Brachionus calyciflorus]|uniref:ascorbate ferrireductase (transmembrane) n=1 Tax=Brachionus calyciflorus TaxID=104777 RepID=A0A813N5C4_9BILA|nr:unnamed protein product [Brachionus calyciflorus]